MKEIVNNKKAFFNYFIEDKFEAGIALKGCEVKSLRQGKCSLVDAYISIIGGEIFLKNCEIPNYSLSTSYKPDPRRVRKLLMNKAEIVKLDQKAKTKGYTIVPTKVYFNDRGIVKVQIALAKGKMLHDKRDVMRQRDLDREAQRYVKG